MNGIDYLVGEVERLRGELATLRAHSIPTGANNPWGLSERQMQVLRLIAQGYSNGQISARCHVSVSTAWRHTHEIYKKIGVRDRLGAARFAWKHGIVCVDEAWETVKTMQWR